MKIAMPKPAPAPTTAERPQLSTTKSGNTGIVPPAPAKPEDSFQQAKPTGTGSTSGNTGIAAAMIFSASYPRAAFASGFAR